MRYPWQTGGFIGPHASYFSLAGSLRWPPAYAAGVLHGRDAERGRIRGLINEAWASRAGCLVLSGQPGVGKTVLLADTVSAAEGMRILRTQGIESESPLAFAALHRLLRPIMKHVGRLPAPQQAALRAAFGESETPVGDRFLVFLAVLSLLAEAAEDAPVLCVIDDAHWLDDASAAALLFVARRLGPERVALLFAARDADLRRFDSGELPLLAVTGLDDAAAADLLSEQSGQQVTPAVVHRLMAHTGGNPLALAELPQVLTLAQLAGTEPLPTDLPLTAGVERAFLDRSKRLSTAAQTLLLVAAVDDTTRAGMVRQAAALLDVGPAAFTELTDSGLLRINGSEMAFRHPLVRSAISQHAGAFDRQSAHRVLAQVMTGPLDADRRAWHLAAAIDNPDETVVGALVEAAERAAARGGYEAASAAYERAAQLTADETASITRLLAAATNAWLAAQLPRAMRLATDARASATDARLRADLDRLRARIEFSVGSVPTAIRIWSSAARNVISADPGRARELGMIATAASTFLPENDRTDLDPAELLNTDLLNAPPQNIPDRARCFTNLLIGFHRLNHDGLAAAVAPLREALTVGRNLDETDLLTNLGIAAFHLGDDVAFGRTFTRMLSHSRDTGAIGQMLFALPRLALADLSAGNWTGAVGHSTEALQLARSTGQLGMAAMPLAQLALYAALRGDPDYDRLLTELHQVTTGQPTGILGVLMADTQRWAQGAHDALAGQPEAALQHFRQMTQPTLTRLAAYDRLDAAVRAGHPDVAAGWLTELEHFADAVDTSHARAVVAHGRASLAAEHASPTEADTLFQQALGYQATAGRPFEEARTRLAYGEFLRRSRHRVDAREHLRKALQTFEDLTATPWAQRATQELRASGETARKRDASASSALTAQEMQVATFVARGLSNRDVAAQLFLSPRTIDFHLRNVFTKTGVSSRGELAQLHFV